jgi:hypothetical protein
MDVQQTADRNNGRASVSDWAKVDRADAMHEYMRQFPVGQRVKISEVVAALTRGGVNVAGKLGRFGGSSSREIAVQLLSNKVLV